ncbi:MAG TPA: ATP-binding protein, partial [Patescibacteria group bacterium]|nr:ATP-binding protein [Patescibacteria group bacterium]
RRSNRELEDIAHIASHDLKEPLRGLIMKASFLREDYADKLDEDGREELDGLVSLAHRSYHLINDLLNLSRAGKREYVVSEVDVNDIVDDISRLLDERLRERNARIIVRERLPHFKGDRHTFTEVFRNLITNAIIYNDKPESVAEVGFLKEKLDGPNVEKNVFYVKDNGIGIDRRLHGEIFRMFKRLVISKKYNESGTGVGLTLVKQMIERCGGRVWLESELGVGSTFYFTLGECSTLSEEKPMVDQLSKSAEEEAQLRKEALASGKVSPDGDRDNDGIPKEQEAGDEQDTAKAVFRPGPNTRPYQKSTDISDHRNA